MRGIGDSSPKFVGFGNSGPKFVGLESQLSGIRVPSLGDWSPNFRGFGSQFSGTPVPISIILNLNYNHTMIITCKLLYVIIVIYLSFVKIDFFCALAVWF